MAIINVKPYNYVINTDNICVAKLIEFDDDEVHHPGILRCSLEITFTNGKTLMIIEYLPARAVYERLSNLADVVITGEQIENLRPGVK